MNISISDFNRPFRIIYVSSIDVYKHQWNLVEAVSKLRKDGIPVELDLIGPAYPAAYKRLQKTLEKVDAKGSFIRYKGVIPYNELPRYYFEADMFVFASSCETFGQILTEAMAAGLPIACSNRGPLPEILQDAGIYFNPQSITDISNALRIMIASPSLREKLSKASYEYAQRFSWPRCADETFSFLEEIGCSFPIKSMD